MSRFWIARGRAVWAGGGVDAPDHLLLEDGSDLLMEDGSSLFLLE
jgi:hypothetical protein